VVAAVEVAAAAAGGTPDEGEVVVDPEGDRRAERR